MARPALICILASIAVASGGCGGGASRTDAQVRELLPGAYSIDCAQRGDTTRCDVLAGRPPGGLEPWTCEFTVEHASGAEAYSGSASCWTERGTPESLRMPTD